MIGKKSQLAATITNERGPMLAQAPMSHFDWCDPDDHPSTPALLNAAMLNLARHPKAIFLGQSVLYPGAATYASLDGIPEGQRIEFPVAEELQTGVAIGLSLQGFLPISIYPRMDFLLRAMDQLVLHLDKLEAMSCGQFRPKVIIRTRVGSKSPLNAGPQHTNDFTVAFQQMLTSVVVRKITHPGAILSTYQAAIDSLDSSLVVEAL